MRHRYSICLYVFFCGILLLGASCKQSEQEDTPVVPATDSEIISYYRSISDAEIPAAPSAGMYREKIEPADVGTQQRRIWELWKQAHTGWTRVFDFAGMNATYKETVWEIPEKERMKVRLFTKGARPAGGYPLIIHLHGGGLYADAPGPWESLINTEEFEINFDLAHRVFQEGQPVAYMVPRMPDDRKGRWYFLPKRVAFKQAIQAAVLSGLVNPDKVYLTGISEGGYGSLRLGIFMPDYFAGVGPMAAAEKINGEAQNYRNTAFRMEVGEKDYQYGRADYAGIWQLEMKALHEQWPEDFVHEVNLQAGQGHEIDYTKVIPWLLNYTRRHYPKRITYRYYDLDGKDSYAAGVYYLGFQNLQPEKGSSLFFDVQHDGNRFVVETKTSQGKVGGSFCLYISEVDFSRPIEVTYNGKTVFHDKITPNVGTMVESTALFGDPSRVYPAKVTLKMQ